MSVVHTVWK